MRCKTPDGRGPLTYWLRWRLIGREGRAPRRLTFLPWLCWLACVLHGTHDADAALLERCDQPAESSRGCSPSAVVVQKVTGRAV